MKKTLLLSTAVVVFSLIFFAGVCIAGGPVTKPVKIMWTGTAYGVGFGSPYDDCNGKLRFINIGTGVSTLSGAVQWFADYCVTPTSTGFIGAGWGIVTAANGDKAYAKISIETDDGAISQTETLVGGTGRFEGMTGDSTSTGIVTGYGTYTYDYDPSLEDALLLEAPTEWQATSTGTWNLHPGSN